MILRQFKVNKKVLLSIYGNNSYRYQELKIAKPSCHKQTKVQWFNFSQYNGKHCREQPLPPTDLGFPHHNVKEICTSKQFQRRQKMFSQTLNQFLLYIYIFGEVRRCIKHLCNFIVRKMLKYYRINMRTLLMTIINNFVSTSDFTYSKQTCLHLQLTIQ